MNADDILYAPISGINQDADFYYRLEHGWYDWHPVSDRAHAWVQKEFPLTYQNMKDGWIGGFLREAPEIVLASYDFPWFRTLHDENYIFVHRPQD